MPTDSPLDEDQPSLRRRRLLAVSGLGVAAVAGCADADDDNGDPAPEDDGEGSVDGDETSEEDEEQEEETDDEEAATPDYSVEGSAPEEVEVGEELSYDMTVRNDGDPVEATYGLDISVAGDDTLEPIVSEQITLSDGETETFESDPFAFEESGTIQWEFYVFADGQDEYIDTAETVVSTPSRAWGESFRTPTDLVITAEEPELTERYEYESFTGDTEVHRADHGDQFAFVNLTIENDSGETRESPNRLDFELVAGHQQLEPMRLTEYERDDVYDGLNDMVDGVVEDGVQPFVVPDDVRIDDLQLFHDSLDFENDASWTVTWG